MLWVGRGGDAEIKMGVVVLRGGGGLSQIVDTLRVRVVM